MVNNKKDEESLLALIGKLPEELQEEGSTGRDLIDSIIREAKEEERKRILNWASRLSNQYISLENLEQALKEGE